MIRENMLVTVNSTFGQGLGWVKDVSDFFFCPVQVELFQPDEHGHKLIRFEYAEVEPVEFTVSTTKQALLEIVEEEVEPTEFSEIEEVEPELNEEYEPEVNMGEVPNTGKKLFEEAVQAFVVDKNPPINLFVRLKEKISGYSFKKGEVFKASGTGTIYDTCYYIYDIETGKQRGCMLKECFDIIQEHEIGSVEVFEEPSVNTPEVVEEPEIKEPEKPIEEDTISKKIEKRVAKLKDTFKSKKPKTVQDALELKGQATLFDFLEG